MDRSAVINSSLLRERPENRCGGAWRQPWRYARAGAAASDIIRGKCPAITPVRFPIISTASVFRPPRRAAKEPPGAEPLADRSLLARHQGKMAGLGAVAPCRPAAASVDGAACRISYVARAFSSQFLVPQHFRRSGLVDARLALSAGRAETGERSGIAFADLPPIDVVLVSHAHYDHLDVATLSRLAAAHRPRLSRRTNHRRAR